MATINNESLELNSYRLDKFGLRPLFSAFLSSCYLGVRKPDLEIFQRALWITGKVATESVFIDDRQSNLINAQKLGMQTIHFQSASKLIEDLKALQVLVPSPAPTVA